MEGKRQCWRASSEAIPQAKKQRNGAAFRLARHFVPRHYDLVFAPQPPRGVFLASAVLKVEVVLPLQSPTRCITLHALDLLIDPAHVTMMSLAAGSSSSLAADVEEDAAVSRCLSVHTTLTHETITLEFSSEIPNEAGAMFLLSFAHFSGVIQASNMTEGLFFCDTRDRNFLATHLEPANARRLFPCFDEPFFRAVFRFTIEFDSRYTAVSGMQVAHEETIALEDSDFAPFLDSTSSALPKRGRAASRNSEEEEKAIGSGIDRMAHTPMKTTTSIKTIGADCFFQFAGDDTTSMNQSYHFTESRSQQLPLSLDGSGSGQHVCCVRRVTFDDTPLLSTSVVGFSIGKFHILEQETSRRQLLCRVIFPVDMQVNQGWYALDLLTKAVDFFDEYCNFPLPLQKLDLVGVRCFNLLGMENWGMIVVGQEYMLVDEATPLERRQRIARLIGHEVAHQWVGNWACIAWWKFLWIKEGFCRYLEFLFVDAVFPGWIIWDEFLMRVLDVALTLDTNPERTRPVEYCSDAPRRIARSFDTISYGKGASIVRMLSSLLGQELLQSATQLLLQRSAGALLDSRMLLDCIRQKEPLQERRQVAEAVLHFAALTGHPLLYIEQGVGVCWVTQYHTPDLRQGILKSYIKRQILEQKQQEKQKEEDCGGREVQQGQQQLHRQHKGSHLVNLFSPRHTRVLRWNPEDFLQRCNCVVPVSVIELENGVSSVPRTILIQKQQETFSAPPGTLLYFNHCGASVLRCDYDTATWHRIFELSLFLTSEDRMVITMTLFRFLYVHIGRDSSHPSDRCTLLLRWLLFITRSDCINASQWKYITEHLERIVYMVRDYDCWNAFSNFVCDLYAPLVLQGTVSFAVQEKTVSFQSQTNLLRHTVLRILQLLAICRSTIMLDDSKQLVEWALASLVSRNTSNLSATSAHRALAFDVENDLDAEAVSIAMQYLTERGDIKVWWTLACVLGTIVGHPLESDAEELRFKVEDVHVTHLLEFQIRLWIKIIAPAVFAFDAGSTLPFLIGMLKRFATVDLSIAKAILRNKRLVTWLFEQNDPNELTPELSVIRRMLVVQGATFCADGNLIALMSACVANDLSSPINSESSYSGDDNITSRPGSSTRCSSSNSSGSDSVGNCQDCMDAAVGIEGVGRNPKAESSFAGNIENAIATMEMNGVWMEYCCDHYHAFLSTVQAAHVAATPRTASYGACVNTDTAGLTGVSI